MDLSGLGIDGLPPGSRVAVLSYLGSFCPITLGHAACIVQAQRVLCGQAPPLGGVSFSPYSACVCCVSVNSDRYVTDKLAKLGSASLSKDQRLHLCALALKAYPSIRLEEPRQFMSELKRCFPRLEFTLWFLNGADDVVKHKKWLASTTDQRFITIGRGSDTKKVLDGIKAAGTAPDHCLVAPETSVASSSDARAALLAGDTVLANSLLHPDVADWCWSDGPYRRVEARAAAPSLASELLPLLCCGNRTRDQ